MWRHVRVLNWIPVKNSVSAKWWWSPSSPSFSAPTSPSPPLPKVPSPPNPPLPSTLHLPAGHAQRPSLYWLILQSNYYIQTKHEIMKHQTSIQFCINLYERALWYNISSSFQIRSWWCKFFCKIRIDISSSIYWPRPRNPPLLLPLPNWRPLIGNSSIAAVGIPVYPVAISAAAAFLLPKQKKILFLKSFTPAKSEEHDSHKSYCDEDQNHPEIQICEKIQILSI